MKEEQESTQAEMLPLTVLLRSRPDLELQEALAAGLESFQGDLLRVLAQFMAKKETKVEDRDILAQGLSIWMSCIACNPELLNILYQDVETLRQQPTGSALDLASSPTLLFASILVERGLVSSDYKIREAFANAIRFIVGSVSGPALCEPPSRFFLRLLLEKMDCVQSNGRAGSRHAKLYFALLKELLPPYLEARASSQSLAAAKVTDPALLLSDMISRLSSYEPSEKKGSFIEDFVLIGLIETISIVVQKCPEEAEPEQLRDLAKLILERCLFGLDFDPIDEHITQEIALEPIERKKISKCHAKESIQSAYSLLLALCKSGRVPGLPATILKDYWLNKVFAVDKPAKAGFAPQSDGRSWQGYCGIKNLGAVCYMSSMLQQWFHVPTLRYCLLAADDRSREDLQEHEGLAVDDNVLHQVMTLFGFL